MGSNDGYTYTQVPQHDAGISSTTAANAIAEFEKAYYEAGINGVENGSEEAYMRLRNNRLAAEEEYARLMEHARLAAEVENSRTAAAVLFEILDQSHPCKVEVGSVYGPGIVMPQLARSTGWDRRVTELSLRSILFVLVNIVIQGSILCFFSKEQTVMDRFAGRMGLCDFGATIPTCPDDIGCTGPGGTLYEPLRRLDFAKWVNNRFTKDSLTDIFPDRADDISNTIDTGEYGVESIVCRLVCCVMYMMSVTKEFFQIQELCKLLWTVPTQADSWISYENSPQPEPIEIRMIYLSQCKLRTAGMPIGWKLFNLVFILCPKTLFWIMTADLGISFLMNTSDITESIVNSMALAFILGIDELIYDTATAARTQYIMEHVEPFHYQKLDCHKKASEDVIQTGDEHSRQKWWPADLWPSRLLLVIFFTWIFLTAYYFTRCTRDDDGAWVALPLYLPKTLNYSPLTAYFPIFFELQVQDEPIWTMPDHA